jgi:hypothetical protein
VVGWFSDFFRLWWGLLYWNVRKSWFRLRPGRSACPCQNPSDSGRAYETGCEACIPWRRQARFRRVCPLLVETKDGLRCSANTADVRPFWGRAAAYYGGALLGIYLAGAVTVFAFLRVVGYPISIVHVTWPGLWHRVPQARTWFYLDRSNRAFAAGRTAEGLLYLANAYEFDPSNYGAGLALAKHYQAGQPLRSDEVFERLIHDHPDHRHATAQEWFRALLARGDFGRIEVLAQSEMLLDPAHAGVWLRALIVATRQLGDDKPLQTLLAGRSAAGIAWAPVLQTELLLRAGRTREARALLDRPWDAPPYALYYRVKNLIAMGDPIAALDWLSRSPGALGGDDVETLRLEAFSTAGTAGLLGREIDAILAPTVTPPAITLLCAHLIRHPNPAVYQRLLDKVQREALPLNTDTAGAWFSLLCTAGALDDQAKLHTLALQLKHASPTPFAALGIIEAYFRGETPERRVTTFLPILPLPLEVTYALIERFSPPQRSATVAVPKNP